MGSRGSGSKGKASGGAAGGGPDPSPSLSGIDAFASIMGLDAENALAEEATRYIDETEDAAIKAVGVAGNNVMYNYSSSAYTDINRAARNMESGIHVPPADKAEVLKLSAALNKVKTDRQMVVYRGINVAALASAFDSGSVVGTVIKNHSFNSTSSKRNVAENFSYGANGVIMKVVLPKGYQGAAPLKKNSKHPNESEILIDRNRSFKVVKAESHNGKRYVTVTPAD